MGRAPQGVVGVASRNREGLPAVIINLPLVQQGERWQPFPTLYWLVDPSLCAQIADIERQGGVQEMEQALLKDPELMKAHRADNVFYAMARWAVLNDREKQAAIQGNLNPILEASGIGGVANHDTVKCLHAQYAFHLARHEVGTTVGKLMHKRYGL